MKKFLVPFMAILSLASISSAFAEHESGYDRAAGTCAILFSGPGMDGPNIRIGEGAQIGNLREYRVANRCEESWNNETGSLEVMPGCEVTAYQYFNFDRDYRTGRKIGGQIRQFPNDGYRVRHVTFAEDGFYKLLSSLTCECRY